MEKIDKVEITKKDFMVEQPVKWCAGCGSYSVMSSVQNVLPQLNNDPDSYVFVSGIGFITI